MCARHQSTVHWRRVRRGVACHRREVFRTSTPAAAPSSTTLTWPPDPQRDHRPRTGHVFVDNQGAGDSHHPHADAMTDPARPERAVDGYADVSQPFAHFSLRRVTERLRQAGAEHVRLQVHAWPLELANGVLLAGSAARTAGPKPTQ